MKQVIANEWRRSSHDKVEYAHILHHDLHPEGLDFFRVRFLESSDYRPPSDFGILASVVKGELELGCKESGSLRMVAGTHAYLPPGSTPNFRGQAGTELILVLAPTPALARGQKLLLRNDQFLAACALPDQPLRWILTPQYLSRRVFLHHDKTLVSRSGNPVSWFHTTRFDVDGLPWNGEGVPVFKMSYNFRTEPNVCYEARGEATIRLALHPYSDGGQSWGPYQVIDGERTYHLSESAAESEWREEAGGRRPFRNKHEVRIVGGHVSLMCMHDPAPTGAESHAAGEYSEYGDLSKILKTPEYQRFLEGLAPLDSMVDVLSVATARSDDDMESLPEWNQYQTGLATQRAMELAMEKELVREGHGRERILREWMLPALV